MRHHENGTSHHLPTKLAATTLAVVMLSGCSSGEVGAMPSEPTTTTSVESITPTPSRVTETETAKPSPEDIAKAESIVANYQRKPGQTLVDFESGKDTVRANEYRNFRNNINFLFVNFSKDVSNDQISTFGKQAAQEANEVSRGLISVTETNVVTASPIASAVYEKNNPNDRVDAYGENNQAFIIAAALMPELNLDENTVVIAISDKTPYNNRGEPVSAYASGLGIEFGDASKYLIKGNNEARQISQNILLHEVGHGLDLGHSSTLTKNGISIEGYITQVAGASRVDLRKFISGNDVEFTEYTSGIMGQSEVPEFSVSQLHLLQQPDEFLSQQPEEYSNLLKPINAVNLSKNKAFVVDPLTDPSSVAFLDIYPIKLNNYNTYITGYAFETKDLGSGMIDVSLNGFTQQNGSNGSTLRNGVVSLGDVILGGDRNKLKVDISPTQSVMISILPDGSVKYAFSDSTK